MLEIKFTIDATPELIGALRDIAGAIHSVPRQMHAMQSTQSDCHAELREGIEKDAAAEKAQNLASEPPVAGGHTEKRENVEKPKKSKHLAKKAPAESDTQVTHAPAPVVEDPAPSTGAGSFACVSYVGDRISETPAPDPAPVEEATASPAEDPLSGKGQTGEILAALTRKAIGDLDALGVDRGDANRRIRDYCASHEIKFPTFPALLQAVGYAEAIAICKGAWK